MPRDRSSPLRRQLCSLTIKLTYKEIEKEFKINKKIDILSSSDADKDISKSMGLAQISFAETFEELRPDIIVVLGDRYEIFSAVAAGMIARIPIAHIHGGESSEGAIDEAIRHSITKMSHLHFTASEEYKNRVCLLYTSPSPRDKRQSRMPASA